MASKSVELSGRRIAQPTHYIVEFAVGLSDALGDIGADANH